MNPYFIFVLVLTAFYILYYIFNVAHDLYGKKDEVKNATEVYDVSDMASGENETEENDSISVTESENGFVIGGQTVETQVDAIDIVNSEVEEPADETAKQNKIEKLIAEAEGKMEDTEVYMSDPMLNEQLARALLAKGLTGKGGVKLEWNMFKDEV